MASIQVTFDSYKQAKDGSLLIKKGDKWIPTSFEELNKENSKKLKEIDSLKIEFDVLKESAKHFKIYAKSHFMVVFIRFMQKVMVGDIDVEDEELLKLDDLVLNGEVSVEEALEKHEFLKSTFNKTYLSSEDVAEYSEV